ncbi:BTAD domain-containing putative transcriptional regulator [Micromonospora sp. NPDC047134]|uniref:BTAD domain-containing putative transcriptional regulator n=1 Tax=Micromonospora sp. NPDC047134 TaxID=3154340 RepID=UPI0033DBBCD6
MAPGVAADAGPVGRFVHVHFRVLGPLVAEVDGREVDLGGPRQRAVLAVLLTAHGSSVSAERLLAQVWSDREPPAMTTLLGYVAALRRALEPDRAARAAARLLVREGPGYALRIPAEAVDAERFTRLVTEGGRHLDRGEPQAALDHLDEGLGLWRGPAYADFPDAPFAASTVARLDSLHATARELRLAALLDVGELATAIGELQALVIEHPLRERGWELLAIALYRAGRQGDALAVLREARERLATELGTDPGPSLLRVQDAILRQDEALGAAAPPAPAKAVTSMPANRNLPAAISSFVGRTTEQARLHALLAAHHLVTVTGPGGVGKTRLVTESLRTRTDPDGPWLVELAGVPDDALLTRTVADALGLPVPAGPAELARLVGPRRTLIVLDNAEHLVGGVAELASGLLSAGEEVRILVTSREPLGIPGEALLELASLPPEDAVRLLIARMALVLPGDAQTEVDWPAARKLCEELDGLPLAIELAAAQCRALSLRDILSQLDDRFALLGTGPSGNHRHVTLKRTIEWSYQLLTPAEQQVFRRLSVFAGGFDLDAAQQVGASPEVPRVLAVLLGLVRKSLVTVEGAHQPRRYRMLDSIRHYAADLLSEAEGAALRLRHRAWLLGLVEAAEPRLLTTDGAHWMRRLRLERDNIAAGLESALAAGDTLGAARICAALAWFWFRTGQITDGTRWGWAAEAALRDEVASDSAHEKELLLIRARLLLAIGGVTYLVGDHAQAAEVFRISAELAERVDARDVRATAVSYLASMLMMGGDVPGALSLADQAVALAEAVGNPGARAEALTVRGQISRAVADLDRAHRELTEANRLARECGHWWAVLSSAWADSKVSVDQGRPEQALHTLQALARETDPGNDRASWLALVHSLAGVLARLGQADRGAVLLGAVAALGAAIGYFPERMDPYDAPASARAVREALSDEAYQAATARGRVLDWAELVSLVRQDDRGHPTAAQRADAAPTEPAVAAVVRS